VAFSVDLVNVNPNGDVAVRVDGDSHVVLAGKTISVTPESAGEAPRWRRATEDEAQWVELPEQPVGRQPMHHRCRAGHLEVFDLGSGLLAQPENWRKVGDDSEPADPLAGAAEPDTDTPPLTGSTVIDPQNTETENS
jgi:hypothetical protein